MIKKIPFILTLLGMFLGILIAIGFGVNEDYFKTNIQKGLSKNVKIQSITNPIEKEKRLKTESSKNWRYYQRFHFHSTGIGAMTLSVLILLLFISAPARAKAIAAYAVSIGGFLYPYVWLFAGIYGPEMGRHEAKEQFAIFGYMGGLFLLGVLFTMVLLIKYPIKDSKHD